MPIYLYYCRHCGHKVEMLRGINEKDNELTCPQCGARELDKVILQFYGNIRGQGGNFSFG